MGPVLWMQAQHPASYPPHQGGPTGASAHVTTAAAANPSQLEERHSTKMPPPFHSSSQKHREGVVAPAPGTGPGTGGGWRMGVDAAMFSDIPTRYAPVLLLTVQHSDPNPTRRQRTQWVPAPLICSLTCLSVCTWLQLLHPRQATHSGPTHDPHTSSPTSPGGAGRRHCHQHTQCHIPECVAQA